MSQRARTRTIYNIFSSPFHKIFVDGVGGQAGSTRSMCGTHTLNDATITTRHPSTEPVSSLIFWINSRIFLIYLRIRLRCPTYPTIFMVGFCTVIHLASWSLCANYSAWGDSDWPPYSVTRCPMWIVCGGVQQTNRWKQQSIHKCSKPCQSGFYINSSPLAAFSPSPTVLILISLIRKSCSPAGMCKILLYSYTRIWIRTNARESSSRTETVS